MHSVCYVIVPKEKYSNYEKYLKDTLAKYYSELEVEPYKEFSTKEETYIEAEKEGFGKDLKSFEKYLKENKSYYDGIENGLLYELTTWNSNGRWDAYSIQDITKLGRDLFDATPFSVVTLDGIWHSELDMGYLPILDFENNFQLHEKNVEPQKQWIEFYQKICKENLEQHFIILDIHS